MGIGYIPRSFLSLLFLIVFAGSLQASEPKVGRPAPDFTAVADTGQEVSLKDFRGKRVVLYFYPKDDTPGCTIEAKSFRDLFQKFQKNNTVILGVSYDDLKSHQAFKKDYQLPYLLLVDKDRNLSKTYGVAGPFFASRTTFIIGPDGVLEKIYNNVNPSLHAEEVLKDFGQGP